jgi:sporulation protein YlmC with PRC-barrel domain
MTAATLQAILKPPYQERRAHDSRLEHRRERETAMAAEFLLGTGASCSDGVCGEVSRTILDPVALTVTHLVIQPKHRGALGRLVPVALADATPGEVKLRCTLAEFERLDPAEETDIVEGAGYSGGYGSAASVQGYGNVGGMGVGGSVSGMGIGMGLGHRTPLVVTHTVPLGEAEVSRHEHVHALDGEIGQVEGFVVDPADHRVTHVLLREGHMWGRKEVAIPISAVVTVDEGIRLNITKEQVGNLPPLT